MDTASHWHKTATLPRFPTLDETITVDVVVVGAGITGITAAYLLKQAGCSVALLERGRCAQVDTGHTSGHLTAVTDRRLTALVKTFGAEAAKAVWAAGTAALQRIHSLAEAERIACGFRWCPGYLFAAEPGEDPAPLRREAGCARQLGIEADFHPTVPVFGRPGVAFPQQALFHPLHYLNGLVAVIPGGGCQVYEETAALETEESHRSLKTAKGRVHFSQLVIATHNPLTGNTSLARSTFFQTKLSLYTSYVLGARVATPGLPTACFWNTAEPYDYVRIEPAGRGHYVIFGGEDHKTGQVTDTVSAYARLEERLRRHFPAAVVDARWSGQVIETNDGLPYLGPLGDRQFIATGFSGNGLTLGTLGAMMAADHIAGRKNPWQQLFDPGRKKVCGGTLHYLAENKDFPVEFLRGWLARPQAASLREIAPGDGKIVRLGKRKVAAHRDGRGRIMLCSAVCTHLQCIVAWNSAEQTWDCPCHGSRFQPDGAVISGPAEEPLPRISPATGRPMRARRKSLAR